MSVTIGVHRWHATRGVSRVRRATSAGLSPVVAVPLAALLTALIVSLTVLVVERFN